MFNAVETWLFMGQFILMCAVILYIAMWRKAEK